MPRVWLFNFSSLKLGDWVISLALVIGLFLFSDSLFHILYWKVSMCYILHKIQYSKLLKVFKYSLSLCNFPLPYLAILTLTGLFINFYFFWGVFPWLRMQQQLQLIRTEEFDRIMIFSYNLPTCTCLMLSNSVFCINESVHIANIRQPSYIVLGQLNLLAWLFSVWINHFSFLGSDWQGIGKSIPGIYQVIYKHSVNAGRAWLKYMFAKLVPKEI